MDKQFKEAFDQVQAEEKLKEHTKQSLYARLHKEQHAIHTSHSRRETKDTKGKYKAGRFGWGGVMPSAAAVVVLAVFIVMGIFNRSVDAQASYIRLDGDVSVGLSLDEEDRVIAVQGLNEQGEQLLKAMNLKGLSYKEAVDCIMESKSRLAGEKPVTETEVTVEGEDEEKCHRLEAEVTKQCNDHEKKHSKSQGSSGNHDGSKSHDISQGQGDTQGQDDIQGQGDTQGQDDIQGQGDIQGHDGSKERGTSANGSHSRNAHHSRKENHH